MLTPSRTAGRHHTTPPTPFLGPDGAPRALEFTSPKADERDVALILLDRCQRHGGEVLLGDKGYASRAFAAAVCERQATFVRPRRKDEAG